MYCISIYLCISLNKSLDLFCIFLGKYKEMGDGSRLLHSTVRHSGPPDHLFSNFTSNS